MLDAAHRMYLFVGLCRGLTPRKRYNESKLTSLLTVNQHERQHRQIRHDGTNRQGLISLPKVT